MCITRCIKRHTAEKREFPQAAFERIAEAVLSIPASPDPFILKIHDIGHHRHVPAAIRDYQSTIETIDQDFREYTGSHGRLRNFHRMVAERFEMAYETACMATVDDNSAKKFYNTTISSPAPAFPGYLDSPDWFRNGLLHALMNDGDKAYQWKLVTP